jgi:serine phosphatase RsbU (regulator of sigma subunit)
MQCCGSRLRPRSYWRVSSVPPIDPRKASTFDRLKAVAHGLKEEATVKRSLTVAMKRQQYMLPRIPEVPGYQFAFVYSPAEHVSGDFCDIIELGGGRYGILVGDISGHGMEAGIVMGAARKALQIYGRSAKTPAHALCWANDDLRRDLDRQTFLTVSYAVLDAATGSLQYVRAGHNHPVLMGPACGQWQEIKAAGTSIGVTGGEQFRKMLKEVTLELKPGQSFLQFTDGIIEAHDPRGEEFGLNRFIEYLERQSESGSALGEMLDSLPAELDGWTEGAPQEDDVTVLTVRRLP